MKPQVRVRSKKPIIFGIILLIIMATESCIPSTYTYYPAQRKINHKFNTNDSIFIIHPFASFKIIGNGDSAFYNDHERVQSMELFAKNYLQLHISNKFKLASLDTKDYERDTLGYEFGEMIQRFYEKRTTKYRLDANSKKRGYGLILGLDWRLSDYWYTIETAVRNSSGHNGPPRLLTFSHLCLFDFKSGEILYYKYHSKFLLNARFNESNVCIDETQVEETMRTNLHALTKRLNRKSPKH